MTDAVTTETTDAATGEAGAGWRDALPEDMRGEAALARFDDVAALAREHVHLQRLIGRKGVIPPGAGAGEEEWARFHDALGRPAAPDGYDLSGIERPEGMAWSDEAQAAMLARMHAAGLTNEQARALVAAYGEVQGAAWQDAAGAAAARLAETGEALRREWGEGFDARLDLANRAFADAFGEDVEAARSLRLADGSWLGDHPLVVRAFAALGARMEEAPLIGGPSAGLAPGRAEAAAELRALEADPDFRAALLDRAHPEHRAALARRSGLARRAWEEPADADDPFGD